MSFMFSSSGTFSVSAGLDPELDGVFPSWLQELRREDHLFLEAFNIASLKGESWKYTDPKPILKKACILSESPPVDISDLLKTVMIKGACNLIVSNEKVSGWQSLTDGIVLAEGVEALNLQEVDRQHFTVITQNDSEFFIRLNRASFCNPLSVTVKQGYAQKELIHIIHVAATTKMASFSRVLIRAEAGSSVSILQTFVSLNGCASLNVPVTDISLDEGAKVEYVEQHVHSSSTAFIGSVRVWQKSDSDFCSLVSTGGAELFRHNLSVMLQGEGAAASVNGLHVLDGNLHADTHTFIEHCVPNTTSNQLVKCVLRGASRSVFNGMIFVHAEAQRTNSYQLNKNLLLSRDCRVDTKPQLEIQADDVKCTHGVTIGQIDKEHLFYFQTRAIAREDAVSMLVRGFIDDVLLRVRNPVIREVLNRG